MSDLLAIEGTQTKLKCRISGYPLPEIKWYKDGKELKRSDDFDYMCDGEECVLIIRMTTRDHSGQYSVRVRVGFGFLAVYVCLTWE